MRGIHALRFFASSCATLVALALSVVSAAATSRIKDLANIEGVRQNQLIGYGLVVGLNGTGDTLNNIPFTKQSLQAMLERMGVNIRGATIRTGNVAAVMVTGNLPPFATQGTRMDVTVSALGDAKNLQGGSFDSPGDRPAHWASQILFNEISKLRASNGVARRSHDGLPDHPSWECRAIREDVSGRGSTACAASVG